MSAELKVIEGGHDAPSLFETEDDKRRAAMAARSLAKSLSEDVLTDILLRIFTEEMMAKLIKKYSPATAVQLHVNGLSERIDVGLHHRQFAEVFLSVQCGNVCLVGPAGSGKTTLAGQIAKALKVQFYFTGAIASEFKLTGFIDAQGRIVSTEFRKAYTEGGLFLFDEIDASMPQAVLAFNNALANDRMDFPDANVPRHPKFYCIAAANTFWTGADLVYVGRNHLDAASLDRFTMIPFEYDEELEMKLAPDPTFTRLVQAYRKAAHQLKMAHVVSPRASIVGGMLIRAGMDPGRVVQIRILKGLGKEEAEKLSAAAKVIVDADSTAAVKK